MFVRSIGLCEWTATTSFTLLALIWARLISHAIYLRKPWATMRHALTTAWTANTRHCQWTIFSAAPTAMSANFEDNIIWLSGEFLLQLSFRNHLHNKVWKLQELWALCSLVSQWRMDKRAGGRLPHSSGSDGNDFLLCILKLLCSLWCLRIPIRPQKKSVDDISKSELTVEADYCRCTTLLMTPTRRD